MSLPDYTTTWWEALLADPERLNKWLKNLYLAEIGGARRFIGIYTKFKPGPSPRRQLRALAGDEYRHAALVGSVLAARGIERPTPPKPERYWDAVWRGVNTFQEACAAGAYGEMLAVNRFRVIAAHPETPSDVRTLVQQIIPDEERHATVLRGLAGKEAMDTIRPFHKDGLDALGIAA